MSIFDAFTGAPARRAAEQTRQHLGGVQTQGLADLSSGYGSAQDAIRTGTTGARGDLTGGYEQAFGLMRPAFDQARGDVNTGFGNAQGLLDQARTQGQGAYQPLSALGQKYGGASSLLLDALGVNGAGGNTRAQGAFQAGPGYQFQVDQSLDAINRARNASGQLAGGNTDQSVLDRASGLANQEYGNYLNRLQSFAPLELSATSGAATGLGGLAQSLGLAGAGLAGQQGTSLAGLSERQGTTLGQLAAGQGGALANLASGQGQSLAGLATGQAGATTGLRTSLAQPYTNTYGQEAAAAQQGSGNLWNLGINAAAMAAGLPPPGNVMGGGGGGGGSARPASSGAPNVLPSSAVFGGSNPFSFGSGF